MKTCLEKRAYACFVGKRHLETALDEFKDEAVFKVTWKPFFLNPSTPDEGIPFLEYISSKYGPDTAKRVSAGKSPLYDDSKKLGITFKIDRLVVNTMKSHCLMEFAKSTNKQNDVAEALFHALFEEGKDVNSDEILSEIGQKLGFDADQMIKSFHDSNLRGSIKKEAETAHHRGITGVPHFDIYVTGLNDTRPLSFSGAQGPDVFLSAFSRLLNALKSKA
ncbi:uncharacterized protein LOC135688383 [Rhopilema esculentum]|uniref:uncharacterized protein LOC135688383 n=1 Tax=Rhopilema esculentum TaxID=499914 RepID=UPI0031D6E52C|eukprot:gene6755-12320_t